jgi:outer membrane murein-binding lipoprotein Lpp
MKDQLQELPSKKSELEETRRFLERLEDRKDQTDPSLYNRLHQKYEEKIEKLEPTIEQLTEEGEARKTELETRRGYELIRAKHAEAKLEEIELLYEEGAMDEETYQEDRRRFRQQKKDAESEASQIKQKLDEIRFYLTETGSVSYDGD